MTHPYVDLLATRPDGTQEAVARFILEAGAVRFESWSPLAGAELWERLAREGIRRSPADPAPVFPRDGRTFLEALKSRFDSAYLRATAVIGAPSS